MKAGLITIVSSLIIGAAIFIYVANALITPLKTSFWGGLTHRSGNTSTVAENETHNASVVLSASFNTSVDGLISITFTVGTLMAVASIAVVGFWIVKSVIGGE